MFDVFSHNFFLNFELDFTLGLFIYRYWVDLCHTTLNEVYSFN